jgi:lipopolysaccharide/colanic/teichoic acid biosynthesis glycosyltransferase
MAVIALAIKLESPGPVFFRQERAGLHGSTFRIYKFRSMVEGATHDGPVRTLRDPRITRTGRLLRRTSLDELPQLLNVLAGEMSLVGPRPLLVGTTRSYEVRRLDMRPGMTGLVQVSNPHLLGWDERMVVDIEYVERWSLLLDFQIMVRTLWIMFDRKNAIDPPRT